MTSKEIPTSVHGWQHSGNTLTVSTWCELGVKKTSSETIASYISQQTRPGSRPFCYARMQTEQGPWALSRELFWLSRDSNSPICNITSFIRQTNARYRWLKGKSMILKELLLLFLSPKPVRAQCHATSSYTCLFLWVHPRGDGAIDEDSLYITSTCSHLGWKFYHAPAKCRNRTDHPAPTELLREAILGTPL